MVEKLDKKKQSLPKYKHPLNYMVLELQLLGYSKEEATQISDKVDDGIFDSVVTRIKKIKVEK